MEETICYTLTEFKTKFPIMLTAFLEDWEDNTENDFLEIQQKLYNECIENTTITNRDLMKFCYVEPKRNSIEEIHDKISEYVDAGEENSFNFLHQMDYRLRIKDIDLCDKYNRSFTKILELINSRIKQIAPQQNNNSNLQETKFSNSNTLNWNGSQLEFAELVQSLILSKKIGIGQNRNEVFDKLREFFNIDKFDEKDKIRDIKNRKKDHTKFINLLETNINNWIES